MTDEVRPARLEQAQTGLFKDTVTDLNNGYRNLIQSFSEGDYCVSYLRTFEFVLSLNCPDQMMWNFEQYKELEAIQPLPDDMDARVTAKTFMAYLMVYEQIMRSVGLIDKAQRQETVTDDLELVLLGGI